MGAKNEKYMYLFIIWLAPGAGKMSQILHCDRLPERARWSYLLPVRLVSKVYSRVTMQSFLRFSRCSGGKLSLKCSVNCQHLPKGKEREWNHPGEVKILFQLQ